MDNFSAQEQRIICGVDFGTTFSGLAWAKVGDAHPTVIQKWPGNNAPSSEKVPTEILYDATEAAGLKWGYQIPSDKRGYQWFKMALESQNAASTSALSKRYPNSHIYTSIWRFSALRLTTDYFRALKSHFISTLSYQLGKIQLEETLLEFIITVPAVWSEGAKEKTLSAAETAGLGRDAPIHMISEPEAAAIYVLHRRKLHSLSPGDTFIVCDAGGGTVDLISYTIVNLDPVIEIREAAPGTGSLCGSTYLNRRFKDFLQFKLGKLPGWDNEVLQEAMYDFENLVKRNFTSSVQNEKYSVRVPGLAADENLGITKRGKFVLQAAEVERIFEPIIGEILKLVLGQIRETSSSVKSILLVGGFGNSIYLRERIEKAVRGVELIQPPYAWSAVVRGALIRGLAPYDPKYASVRLSSRAANKHLGTTITINFNKDIHLPSKKFFNTYDGQFKISVMQWYIEKGDSVREDQPFRFPYFKTQPVTEGRPDKFTQPILCDRSGRPPVLYRDGQVTELVVLTADIGYIPERLIARSIGMDGKMYYRFDYVIEITFMSASTRYVLIYGGMRYDSITAEYA